MNKELKPCPFCGSTNIHARTLPAFFHELGRGWAVVCFDCFARGPYVKNEKYGRTSHSAEAKRDAIEAWNRMADGERGETKEQKAIVRCKDCKHHLECDYWIENGDDWFCADGERIDNNE